MEILKKQMKEETKKNKMLDYMEIMKRNKKVQATH